MKKFYYFMSLALLSGILMLSACDKDDNDKNPTDNKKTVNLKVSMGLQIPGSTEGQLYIKTLTKDSLDKIFSDANVEKLNIEFVGGGDFSTVHPTHITRMIDSLYQAKTNLKYGNMIVVADTDWLLLPGSMDVLSAETKQKMKTLGLTVVPIAPTVVRVPYTLASNNACGIEGQFVRTALSEENIANVRNANPAGAVLTPKISCQDAVNHSAAQINGAVNEMVQLAQAQGLTLISDTLYAHEGNLSALDMNALAVAKICVLVK